MKLLEELSAKQLLFYWQQRAVEKLPDEFDIQLSQDKLVFKFNGEELVRAKPPTSEHADFDMLELLESRVHWLEKVREVLPERCTAKLVVAPGSPTAATESITLLIEVDRNEKELFRITPPAVKDPTDFNDNFWISGEHIQANYLISGSALKTRLVEVVNALDVRRKLSNLYGAKCSHLDVLRDDNYFGPKIALYPKAANTFGTSIELRIKPILYEVVYTSRPQVVIGSSVDQLKAFGLVEKGIKKYWDK